MVVFGLIAMVMMMLIGTAVDYGRWVDARRKTAEAMDAAVLAAGRSLQTNGGNKTEALAIARKYYAQAIKTRLKVFADTIDFEVTDDGTAVTAKGNAHIATPFMKLAGVPSLPLLNMTGTEYSKSKLSVGENADKSLEIAMILDMSGSMATGTKLADLKAAANDLIDIVVWEDQSEYYSKLSIVPYATAVNVGAYAASVRGSYSSGTCTSPGCQSYKFQNPYGQYNTFASSSTCVSERTGAQAFTDAAPSTAQVGKNYPSPNNKCLSPAITPLSNNKTTLHNSVAALKAEGSTGGQIGVAWGWYTLSPNWNALWPAESRPAAYGAEDLEKFLILMTDGEYNSSYCNGVISQDSLSGSGATADHIKCNAPNGDSYVQAEKLCTKIKESGITVYTVGFQIVNSQRAVDLLKHCATDSTSYYDASDGEALRQSFHDIALRISKLYLSK